MTLRRTRKRDLAVWRLQPITANKRKRADEGIKTFVSLYKHLWV